jgi:hypothetical protein
MKKFWVFLIIIAILGGTLFLLGWAQLGIPVNTWGVMQSKTHGVESAVLRDGEFRWVWYKLIPTNVKIIAFTPKTISRSFKTAGTLSQGDAYLRFTGISANFSWAVSGKIEFTLKPEALPALVSQRNIEDQAGLDTFTGELAANITNYITQQLISYSENAPFAAEIQKNLTSNTLQAEIAGKYPDIEIVSLFLVAEAEPDFEAYRLAKTLYTDYLESQRLVLQETTRNNAEERVRSQYELDELERYGELLSKYPLLLDYILKIKAR